MTHHTVLRNVAWRDKTWRVLKTWTNQVSKCKNRVSSFQKPAFFYIHHAKEFWETIYFSRSKTITICTYNESTDQQHLRVQFKTNLSELQFKFLGNKKGPMEGFFYLESVFLYQVFLLNYQNCFYISEGYISEVFCARLCKLKRDWYMILNFRRESFSKTGMFLRAFQKLPQNAQQKNREV